MRIIGPDIWSVFVPFGTHIHMYTQIHAECDAPKAMANLFILFGYLISKILLCKENYVCVDMHSVALYMSHSTLYHSTALITDQRGAPAIGIVAEDDTHNLYVGLWLVIMSD